MNKKLLLFLQRFLLPFHYCTFAFPGSLSICPEHPFCGCLSVMRYLYLSKHARVYIYVWSHTCRNVHVECVRTQHSPPISPLPAFCLKFAIYIVWTIKTSFPQPPAPQGGIHGHFWLRRQATVFTLRSLLNCVFLLEIFLQSSFTSQFSSQQSTLPVPLYFACLLMPQSSLPSRTDGFWNKHSLTGELPHDPFRPVSCYDGARHHSPDRRRCACTARHRITIRLVKTKMILAMPVRHRLPKRTKSKESVW